MSYYQCYLEEPQGCHNLSIPNNQDLLDVQLLIVALLYPLHIKKCLLNTPYPSWSLENPLDLNNPQERGIEGFSTHKYYLKNFSSFLG